MADLPFQIANFFTAMQAGRAGGAALSDLFAEDAVYEEPFSGAPQRHSGRTAVMAAMARGWEQPLPEMRIAIDRAETQGNVIELQWTCYSPALPGGKGQGRNRFVMRDGLIAELVTTFGG
jgi:hypothetical protein